MSRCRQTYLSHEPRPRSCSLCGLGPCSQAPKETDPLTVSGIGREDAAPRGAALTVYFNRRPTDDEMRGVNEALRSLVNGG